MLVLSRRPGESVQIGDGVRVVVVRVDRGQVRLGIEAPEGVRVLRSELLETADPAAQRGQARPGRRA